MCENIADGETREDAVARARELLADQVRQPSPPVDCSPDVVWSAFPVMGALHGEPAPCTCGFMPCPPITLGFYEACLSLRLSSQIPEDASVLEGEGASRPAPADEPWDALEAPPEETPYKPQAPPKKQFTVTQIVLLYSLIGAVLSIIAMYLAKLLSEFVQKSGKDHSLSDLLGL